MMRIANTPTAQRGAALMVGMVVLLMLTVLGLSAIRSTALEEQMAGNDLDRQKAFEAAEAGLRGGEAFLRDETLPQFTDAGAGGYYLPADPDGDPVWELTTWGNNDSVAYQGDLDGASARYVIEQMGVANLVGQSLSSDSPVEVTTFYRVTSQGDGVTTASDVTLQTVYKR